MSTAMLVYQLLIAAVLLALLGILVVNLRVLPRIQRFQSLHGEAPSAAILVPARNEEANIEACLVSLLAQRYPNFQVWVYDDASIDRTGEIAARLAKRSYGRLRAVKGYFDPPPGWLGKSNACHQLYLAVRKTYQPDYVLFTDADVKLAPDALAHAISAAQQLDTGLLSIFPAQITASWAERLAVPLLLHWTVYTFLPLPLAQSRTTSAAFAAANGQFMLFKREAYDAFGGHEAVRSQILEDVALARATKRAGCRAVLADGGAMVQTRMYRGAGEVWNGYSKNAFAFFGYRVSLLILGIVVLLALYVAPVFFMLVGLLSGDWLLFGLAAGQYLLAVVARLPLSLRFGYSIRDAFLHPVAIIYIVAIELNSMRWSLLGRSAWKGRLYTGLGRSREGSE